MNNKKVTGLCIKLEHKTFVSQTTSLGGLDLLHLFQFLNFLLPEGSLFGCQVSLGMF